MVATPKIPGKLFSQSLYFQIMKKELQPILENDLILLRPLGLSDYDQLFEAASDPLIWETHPQPDRFKADVFKHFFDEAKNSNGALVVIDKKTSRIIGVTGYYDLKENPSSLTIGFTFLERKYWGGFYNAAVKKLLVNYALKLVNAVYFQVGVDNLRARKSLEKLGAIKTGEQEVRVSPTRSIRFNVFKIETPL